VILWASAQQQNPRAKRILYGLLKKQKIEYFQGSIGIFKRRREPHQADQYSSPPL
jgi:hypothetical protein